MSLQLLFDVHQRAYKINHSTETDLVLVTNRLLTFADKMNVSVLYRLLDLSVSAAFDMLLVRQSDPSSPATCGITGQL